MERWGYINVAPDPNDQRPKPPPSAWLIRPTAAGRKAQEIWQPLLAVIEKRWQQRFGNGDIGELRKSLLALVNQLDPNLPDCLPILGYGLFSRQPAKQRQKPLQPMHDDTASLSLPSLLSKVLLAFAIEFESESDVSLAVCANVLRLAGADATPLRDLPRLAGVSKESIAMAMTFLTKRRYAVVKTASPGSRMKMIELTPLGHRARNTYFQLLPAIEHRWQAQFGEEIIRTVRNSLGRLADEHATNPSPLFRGLEPYPDGWRAAVSRPEGLPHYPMVLHRGGYPDGS